jgi:outer membrane protein OmpA-like peptidoglycan-associated protein
MSLPADVFKPLRAALASGKIEDVLACLDPDGTVVVQLGTENTVLNGDVLRTGLQGFLSAFESQSLTAVSRSPSGSAIAEEAVFSGNHIAPWAGFEPTHRRVHFNVRLVAETASAGTLHSLWVEPDHQALLAQIAGSDDILGVTGGLLAAVRERAVRPVWVTGGSPDGTETGTGTWSGPDRRKAHIRRRGYLVTASLVLMTAMVAVGLRMVLPSGDAPAGSAVYVLAPASQKPPKAAPPATPRQVKQPPKRVVPRQPVIRTASPKSVPRVQAGRQLVLSSDVLFGLASSAVTPGARAVLLRVAAGVRAARVTGTIQINGHTDGSGASKTNLALSQTRALAVARVLQPALSGLRIVLAPQGFGETTPIASNSTPLGAARNRRVQIVLPRP